MVQLVLVYLSKEEGHRMFLREGAAEDSRRLAEEKRE